MRYTIPYMGIITILLLFISILLQSVQLANNRSDEIQYLDENDENYRLNQIPSAETRSTRDIWTDNFENDVMIKELNNVVLKNKTIELAKKSIILSSTDDFNAGTKNNIATETDEYLIPFGQIRIKSPSYEKDIALKMFLPMNEGSGVDVNDATIHNNDGRIRGSTWTNGIYNNALYFDGDSDQVTVVDNKTLDFGSSESFTLEAWIKTKVTFASSILIKYRERYAQYYHLGIKSNGVVHFTIRGESSDAVGVQSKSRVNDDHWHYIVGVRDVSANRLSIYIDGILENSIEDTTKGHFNNPGTLVLGKTIGGNSQNFIGKIDEVKIFNRTRSSTEIESHYNSGKSYFSSGIWESTHIELYNIFSLSDTSIEFTDVMLDKSKIDRIEWLEAGMIKARYETDIKEPGKSNLTIINSEITTGSYKNIRSNFTIRLYLTGDGDHTPIINKISVKLQYLQGHVTSMQIAMNQNYRWDKFTLSKAVNPPDGTLKVSILDGVTCAYIEGFKNLTETFYNISSIDSIEHPIIRLRADFYSINEFSPKLNKWSISWKEDYPILEQEIPSTFSVHEDSEAIHLIFLGDYFKDYYSPIEDLIFKVIYQTNKKYLEAKVDGQYLDFFTKLKDWTGIESFQVECMDTGGLTMVSNEFDVTVTPVDDPPVWSKDLPNLKIDEDTIRKDWLDLDDYVYDIEGDYLDFRIVAYSDLENVFITIESDNKVTVEPVKDFYGSVSITIKVYQPKNELYAEDSFEIIVFPTSDPPIIAYIPNQTVLEDDWLNFTLPVIDNDMNETFNFYSNITKKNFKLDSNTGKINFHPTNDDIGILFVNITVEDKDSLKGYRHFQIKVLNVNDPPNDPAIIKPKNGSKFKINERINFIAEVCNDTDVSDIISYSWDFDITNGLQKDRTGREVNYTFLASGKYIVTLTISEGTTEKSVNISLYITPSSQPPGPHPGNDDKNNLLIMMLILIVIICLILVAFLIIQNKKKSILKKYLKEIELAHDLARTNPAIGKEKLSNIKIKLPNDLKEGRLNAKGYNKLEKTLNENMKRLGMTIAVSPQIKLSTSTPIQVIRQPVVGQAQISSIPIKQQTLSPRVSPVQPSITTEPELSDKSSKVSLTTPHVQLQTQQSTLQLDNKPTHRLPYLDKKTQTSAQKKELVQCFNCGNYISVELASNIDPILVTCLKCGQKGTI